MALPHSEWLGKAQALAIGQSRRTYHNEENRTNLIVGNDPDRWWCYCHRCHDGGVLMKEHVQVGASIEQQDRFMPWPDDAKPFGHDAAFVRTVGRLLTPKGIDITTVLSGIPLMQTVKQSRLLVGTSQGWLGRAVGNVQPKWCAYRGPQGAPVYALHPEDSLRGGEHVILTEDYFSALKVRWALDGGSGYTPCAALGTSLHPKLLAKLIHAGSVTLMFDGDRAGDEGTTKCARRLRGLGKQVRCCVIPRDKDPKDLHAAQILEVLRAE